MFLAIALAVFGSSDPVCAPGDPTACLRWARLNGNATAVVLSESSLVGVWPDGASSRLYMFSDHTFIHTQWSDLSSEVIYDKGQWLLAKSVLTLKPDTDITWKVINDRHFVTLRQDGDAADLLMGLERAFAYLSYMIAENPKDGPKYLRLASRVRSETWPTFQEEGVKAELMKRCWRPDWYAK
jgi:hypothetical protein